MTRNAASVAAAAARRAPPEAGASAARPKAARLASEEASPVASHVHTLQDLLSQSLDGTPQSSWSPRATMGFVLLICGAFWLGVGLAIRLLLH